jgi:hypothetical protein
MRHCRDQSQIPLLYLPMSATKVDLEEDKRYSLGNVVLRR